MAKKDKTQEQAGEAQAPARKAHGAARPAPRRYAIAHLAVAQRTPPAVLAGCRTHYGWDEGTVLTTSEYHAAVVAWLAMKP